MERGRELLTLGEPERAAHVIGEALALWRGRALVELEGWSPARIEAARLDELRLDAQEVLVDAALRRAGTGRCWRRPRPGGRGAAAGAALGAAGPGPVPGRPPGRGAAHPAPGRTVLAAELGVDPGPDLVALEAAILRQDPSLVADTALPEPSATCPYLGLVPYDVADAEGFFGRDPGRGGVPAPAGGCRGAGGGGAVGQRQVVAGAGRGGGRAARDGRRSWWSPRALTRWTPSPCRDPRTGPGAGGRPVRGGRRAVRRPGEQARFFAALAAHAERGRWSWRCGPTAWASCRPTRCSPA